MANFVNTNVYFAQLSDAGKQVFRDILSRVREADDNSMSELFTDIFVDGQEGSPSYEDTETMEFTCANVGPKWCHLEYFEDFDGESFRTVSAWSWPQLGVEWLFARIGEVDPDFIGVASFEDESPVFIGAAVYNVHGMYDYYEEEYEELMEIMKERVEELNQYWNEEENCFEEAGNDLMYEHMYDIINDLQTEFIDNCLEEIRDARESEADIE